MEEKSGVALADLTTLRVGGPAARFIEIEDTDDLVKVALDVGRDHCFILGAGSNVVVSDDGIDATVLRVQTSGVEVVRTGDHVELTVAAGENWDDLVTKAVDEGWAGLEALSGIPGTVGATPIQNVGAYGQEVAETVVGVDVFDALTGRRHFMSAQDCGFGYRTSVFKREPDRFVVLGVRFRLRPAAVGAAITYSELAKTLGVEVGATAGLSDVRDAVLALRRGKGMVLDAADRDTWSAGSFFTNPILNASQAIPPDAPRWPQSDGRTKTSAAWLIERAGFAKGFGSDVGRGQARVSSKHTLAVTNRGEATTEELLTLARLIRDGVRSTFGIELHPEPTLVGCRL